MRLQRIICSIIIISFIVPFSNISSTIIEPLNNNPSFIDFTSNETQGIEITIPNNINVTLASLNIKENESGVYKPSVKNISIRINNSDEIFNRFISANSKLGFLNLLNTFPFFNTDNLTILGNGNLSRSIGESIEKDIDINKTRVSFSVNITTPQIISQSIIDPPLKSPEMGRFGQFVTTDFDVNGDNINDLLVLDAYSYLSIYYGSKMGIKSNPDVLINAPNECDDFHKSPIVENGFLYLLCGDGYSSNIISYPLFSKEFGSTYTIVPCKFPNEKLEIKSIADLGDLNNDGINELGLYGVSEESVGLMRILKGTPIGYSYNNSIDINNTWRGFIGISGDFNNDGFDDVIGYYEDYSGIIDILIFYGGIDYFNSQRETIIFPLINSSFDIWTKIVGNGDINNDGYEDLIVVATMKWNEVILIYLGSKDGISTSPIILRIPEIENFSTGGISYIGDINFDGYDDFLIGIKSIDFSVNKAYIFSGTSKLQNISFSTILGETNDEEFGTSVTGGSDINDDGKSDYVIGAESFFNKYINNSLGRVYIYYNPFQIIENKSYLNISIPDINVTIWSGKVGNNDIIKIPDFTNELQQVIELLPIQYIDKNGNRYVRLNFSFSSSSPLKISFSEFSIYYSLRITKLKDGLNQYILEHGKEYPLGTKIKIPLIFISTIQQIEISNFKIITENKPPIGPSFGTFEAVEEQEFNTSFNVIDPEDKPLNVNVWNPPDGLELINNFKNNYTIKWTPTNLQAARQYYIFLNISDGEFLVHDVMRIFVRNVNDPVYIINDNFNLTATEDFRFMEKIIVEDDDLLNPSNEQIFYSLIQSPPGMYITDDGELNWVPGENDANRVIDVIVRVSDGKTLDQKKFMIPVNDILDPIQIISSPIEVGYEEINYLYTFFIRSENNYQENYNVTLIESPTGMKISPHNMTIYWISPKIGQYHIKFNISNGIYNASQSYEIKILPQIEISITAFKKNLNYEDFLIIDGSVKANVGNITEIRIRLNKNDWKKIEISPGTKIDFEFTYRNSEVDSGTNEITINATNVFNHQQEKSININYQKNSYNEIYNTIFSILIIITIFAIIFFERRRDHPKN